MSGFREGLMQEVHVVYFTPFIRIFGDFLKKSVAKCADKIEETLAKKR